MQDIRQSLLFARYMKELGWAAEKIGANFIYTRRFSLLGYFAKIPRSNMPVDAKRILDFKKTRKIFRLKISPFADSADKKYQQYKNLFLRSGFKIDHSPFNPTTNYLINMQLDEKEIFDNFSEAKRRAVRRALKNNITVCESDDLESFIKIRERQYLPIWFLVGGNMRKLWQSFYPKGATLLLAYEPIVSKPVAGILLLFYGRVAYYWLASSLPVGKKLFAPTLLVWEALKLSKKRGCQIFDFEGIYDERFPKASSSWKGFTKFKEGFGGRKVVYLENFYI